MAMATESLQNFQKSHPQEPDRLKTIFGSFSIFDIHIKLTKAVAIVQIFQKMFFGKSLKGSFTPIGDLSGLPRVEEKLVSLSFTYTHRVANSDSLRFRLLQH
jgi:hypothetical protein